MYGMVYFVLCVWCRIGHDMGHSVRYGIVLYVFHYIFVVLQFAFVCLVFCLVCFGVFCTAWCILYCMV